jgi:hypothetical protein
MTPVDCGIKMVHNREGYICGRLGSDVCSDCGTTLCAVHSGACEFCLQIYCDCCLYFHAKEPHARRRSIGTVTLPEYRRSA